MTLEEQILIGMRTEFVKFHRYQHQLFPECEDKEYSTEELRQRRDDAYGAFSALYSYCCIDRDNFPQYRSFFDATAKKELIHNGSLGIYDELLDDAAYHDYRLKIGGIAIGNKHADDYPDLKRMLDETNILYMLEDVKK